MQTGRGLRGGSLLGPRAACGPRTSGPEGGNREAAESRAPHTRGCKEAHSPSPGGGTVSPGPPRPAAPLPQGTWLCHR